MIIDCISDLHGHYPKLDGGDLLIVAGDLTTKSTSFEYGEFSAWLHAQEYEKKIYIAGNHDTYLEKWHAIINKVCPNAIYLCDSGTEFDGLKIWGSPWTKTFSGMNPKCKAFTVDTEEELTEKWAMIPDDTDILVTHGPPADILDELIEEGKHGGSEALLNVVKRIQVPGIKHKFHIFGHIHEGYGSKVSFPMTFINCSHVNERYEPVNKPIRIVL